MHQIMDPDNQVLIEGKFTYDKKIKSQKLN